MAFPFYDLRYCTVFFIPIILHICIFSDVYIKGQATLLRIFIHSYHSDKSVQARHVSEIRYVACAYVGGVSWYIKSQTGRNKNSSVVLIEWYRHILFIEPYQVLSRVFEEISGDTSGLSLGSPASLSNL
jgi:hypothetical protein